MSTIALIFVFYSLILLIFGVPSIVDYGLNKLKNPVTYFFLAVVLSFSLANLIYFSFSLI